MKIRKVVKAFSIIFCLSLGSCGLFQPIGLQSSAGHSPDLRGTWKLISNEIITNGQTERVFPVEGQEMIKIFNDTHFAFFKHDIHKGKGEGTVFESGSGRYSLQGTTYQEKLEYCNFRDWENHEFSFQLTLKKDTLIQRGIEKIDSLNINREIIETYVRLQE